MCHKLNFKNAAILTALFAVSVGIRMFLSIYPKTTSFYPDELIYFSYSKSILQSGQRLIYQQPNYFTKILYEVLVSPARLCGNVTQQIVVMTVMNCFMISLGIFPVYQLARLILKDKSRFVWLSCLLYVVFSDLSYSATLMLENIYLPIALWGILALCRFGLRLQSIAESHALNRSDVGNACFVGTLMYLIFACKSIGEAFILTLAAVGLIELVHEWIEQKSWKQIRPAVIYYAIAVLTCFALCVIDKEVFAILNSASVSDGSSKSAADQSYKLLYTFYATIYYIMMIMSAYCMYPVTVSAFTFRKQDRESKVLSEVLFSLLLIMAVVVAYLISAREDIGSFIPRIHLRYVTYLFVPFVILMLGSLCQLKHVNMKLFFAVHAFSFIWIANYFVSQDHAGIKTNIYDQTMLKYISYFEGKQAMIAGGLIACLTLLLILLMKKSKYATAGIVGMLLLTNCVNTVIAKKDIQSKNGISQSQLAAAETMEQHVKNNPDCNYLILNHSAKSLWSLDTYCDESNVYQIDSASLDEYLKTENPKMTWADASNTLYSTRYMQKYPALTEVDYLIVSDYISVNLKDSDALEEMKNLSSDTYRVYHLKDPKEIPEMIRIEQLDLT